MLRNPSVTIQRISYPRCDYAVTVEAEQKTMLHDVVSINPILLDLKERPAPKNPKAGVYGFNWWNAYIPIPVMKKLCAEIQKITGYSVSRECKIMDETQGLCSVTMNIKTLDQSPQVTMFMEREIDVENPDDPDTTIKETQLTQDELGTLVERCWLVAWASLPSDSHAKDM